MSTQDRLERYGFATPIIEVVSRFAEEQQGHDDYGATFESVGIYGLKRVIFSGYLPVDVVDIQPSAGYDPDEAMLVHLAMANPLDPNQLYQLATIAGTNPNKRIIAAANPSGLGYDSGRLTRPQRANIRAGDLRPAVEPAIKYLESQGINRVHQVGYSYGAERALTAASADAFETPSCVAIEPVSVIKRGLIGLGLSFASTAKELERYVGDSQTPAFEAARSESVGATAYNIGLLRPSNIAVARGLARERTDQRAREALLTHPELVVYAAWGSESELAVYGVTKAIIDGLRKTFGGDRVRERVIEGGKHALANDIHLQAAAVLEGLSGAYGA